MQATRPPRFCSSLELDTATSCFERGDDFLELFW